MPQGSHRTEAYTAFLPGLLTRLFCRGKMAVMRFVAKSVSGQRLSALRGKRSREWVAHELRNRGHATDAKAIWRWENGRNQPNARVLPDYADVLGAESVDELYGDDDEEEPSMSVLADDLIAVVTRIVDARLAKDAA